MFYLVGIGLRPEHLTLEAKEILESCDQLFLESYTSEYSEGNLKELGEKIGRKFKKFGRKEVEEGMGGILASAKKNDISLMVFGNPLTATTHLQLMLDAKKQGVKVKVIPGISITNMVAKTGLDEYKFGRTVTVCYHSEGYEPESFYDRIKKNMKGGMHTLCLLDIKKEEGRMMNCAEAIGVLEKIAERRGEKSGPVSEWAFAAMISMGSAKEKIIAGKENIMTNESVKRDFPQSLVVAGKLNEKEKEALETLHRE